MPWLEANPWNNANASFAITWGYTTMTELCARHAISRKTGYKWLARFDAGGRAALGDRSRAPPHCPHRWRRMVAHSAAARGTIRLGARKAAALAGAAASRSSCGRRSAPPAICCAPRFGEEAAAPPPPQHPGVVPQPRRTPTILDADFKGHFRTARRRLLLPADRRRPAHALPARLPRCSRRKARACGPASIASFASMGCRARFAPTMASRSRRPAFTASRQLNVWWMRLGIQHQRILPAQPQQNGAHERMHKTLKAEAIRPPRATLVAQQRAFNRLRNEYNDERPHEFLRGPTPASAIGRRPAPTPAAAADRVSRALPREAHHQRRHVPVQDAPALPRRRPCGTSSALRKSTMASGRFTSATCCWDGSTNETSAGDRATGCYPCSRFTLLPMFPVAAGNHRAAASALSSGRVLKAIAAPGAAL